MSTKTKLSNAADLEQLFSRLRQQAAENLADLPKPASYPCVAVVDCVEAEYDYWSLDYVYPSDFDGLFTEHVHTGSATFHSQPATKRL